MAVKKSNDGVQMIVLAKPLIGKAHIRVEGVTSLIVHAWSEKAKRMMLEAQQANGAGATKRKKSRADRDPQADYESSKYVSTDGWEGVPAASFKAALVGACRLVENLHMTTARRLLHVRHDGYNATDGMELVRIYGEPSMRQDMVRLESGTADLRYRAEYKKWSAVLSVEFNASLISRDVLVNLIDHAGYAEGIGEWRPSSPKSHTGSHGKWQVVEALGEEPA